MKTNTNQKPLTRAILIGMMAIGANLACAENEPTDNEPSGASTVELGSKGLPAIPYGYISNSDQDWYKITNTAGYTSIVVTFAFQGSGPETCRLQILGPDGMTELFDQQTETGSNPYQRSYTISGPAKGAVYYIGCLGDSADGTKSYTLTIDPSPNFDRLAAIEVLKNEIARLEWMIDKFEAKGAELLAKGKQQAAKLKKTKSKSKKVKIKTLILKYKLDRSGLKVKIVKTQGLLRDLKQQLLTVEGTTP